MPPKRTTRADSKETQVKKPAEMAEKDEPAKKRGRAAKETAKDVPENGDADAGNVPKPRSRRAAKQESDEVDVIAEEVKKVPRKRNAKQTVPQEDAKSTETEIEEPAKKASKKRGARKPTNEIEEIEEAATKESEEPLKNVTRRRGKKTVEEEPEKPAKKQSDDTEEAEDTETKEKQSGKAKPRGKKAGKSKEETEDDVEMIEEKEPTETARTAKLKGKQTAKKEEGEIEDWQKAKTIYEFKVNNIEGEEVSLDKYKGRVCIIVNVASKCGHTKSNYEQLVELYEKYSKEKGLRILAFPCNQFSSQEPGSAEKICEFVKKRNVTFDMFEKVFVNGKNAHPLWKFLNDKIEGPKGNVIDWNFTKFIINKKGEVVERCKPTVKPLQMVESLEKLW